MTSKVTLKVKPASRGVCVMMTWDGVPAQLKNDETFVWVSKTNESHDTPQTETADPCGGCIFSFAFQAAEASLTLHASNFFSRTRALRNFTVWRSRGELHDLKQTRAEAAF